jgi:hypothetical protein
MPYSDGAQGTDKPSLMEQYLFMLVIEGRIPGTEVTTNEDGTKYRLKMSFGDLAAMNLMDIKNAEILIMNRPDNFTREVTLVVESAR